MQIQRYKISNLLSYQVAEIQSMIGETIVTVNQNDKQPHFFDAYAGLTSSEVKILTDLGFCVTKHVIIGEGVLA